MSDSLAPQHQALVARHREALSQAANALLACSGWTLEAPALLLRPGSGQAGTVAVGQLGRWIPHLSPALDGFVRLCQQGLDPDSARRRCLAEQGDGFDQAWREAEQARPLISHDDLSRFADLSRRGWRREPKELLVVVQWPQQVTAFLVRCERIAGQAPPAEGP